jgi:hypothetical protein
MKNRRHDVEDALPSGLDPEVAALARAAAAAAAAEKERNRSLIAEIDGKPIEMKLSFGPTAMLCLGAGLFSAAGALIIYSMPDADFLALILSQLPAAGLIAAAFTIHDRRAARRG